MQIPLIMDIPALITGNYLSTEGTVTSIEHDKSYYTVHIKDVEIKESTWFIFTTIKEYNRYKISYLKHSKSIIKVEKLD